MSFRADTTLAKDEFEAVFKLLDAIDLIRGIWNLRNNKSIAFNFVGRKNPINQITLGALHTIHYKDGSEASKTSWYEPDYIKNSRKFDFSTDSYATLKFTKDIRRKIKQSKYRNIIELGIIRYVRSLDSIDYNAAFLKLWSVLEYLTSTLRNGYDLTIKRTVFHNQDRDYNLQILQILRDYRNKSVHVGTGDQDIDAHVYLLKGYVEQLLRFHIGNVFNFDSFEEACEFMDLKTDSDSLNKQISMRRSALKYLK